MTTSLSEPFLSSEVAFRQQRVREMYSRHPRKHSVRRRRGLRLPHGRRSRLVLA